MSYKISLKALNPNLIIKGNFDYQVQNSYFRQLLQTLLMARSLAVVYQVWSAD